MVTFAMPLLLIILFFHYCYHIMYCSMCPFPCFLFPCIFNTRRALTVSPLRNDAALLLYKKKAENQRRPPGRDLQASHDVFTYVMRETSFSSHVVFFFCLFFFLSLLHLMHLHWVSVCCWR